VQVHTAIGDDLTIRGPNPTQQLERLGSWSDAAIVAAVPHFDAVQFLFD
jgi:hypothetical protein